MLGLGIGFEPNAGAPLFRVSMPKGAVLAAKWGKDKRIKLSAPQATAADDSEMAFDYHLAADFDLKVRAFGSEAHAVRDAAAVVPATGRPRTRATVEIFPWSFGDTAMPASMPASASSSALFGLELGSLPEFASKGFEGSFGVRAATTAALHYRTTRIEIVGADEAITSSDGSVNLPAIDGDFMEVEASVEGAFSLTGTMYAEPWARLTRTVIGPMEIDLNFSPSDKHYGTDPTPLAFPKTRFRIPLPNVHVPQAPIALGNAPSKTIEIENSGELAATLSFESSDASFSVTRKTIRVPPKGRYALVVERSGGGSGSADITVTSNDPDSPLQTLRVLAN